jgi:hypothetical protein
MNDDRSQGQGQSKRTLGVELSPQARTDKRVTNWSNQAIVERREQSTTSIATSYQVRLVDNG